MKSLKWYDILILRCLKKRSKGEKKYIMEREKLTVHLEGETEIEVDTLISTLENTIDCLSIIAGNVLAKEDFCKFVVKDMRKGSFILDIEVIKNIVENIAPIVQVAEPVVSTFIEIVKFKKSLKGQLPKEIKEIDDNKVNITLNDNSSIVINNPIVNMYLNNPELDDKLSKLSGDIYKDQKRGSVKISDGKKELCIDKKELTTMSTPIDIGKINNDSKENYIDIWLNVKKGVFQGKERWDFTSSVFPKPITAKILDNDFLEKVHNGDIVFSANTKIYVKLRVEGKKSEDGTPIGRQTYTVVKVYDVDTVAVKIEPLL